VNKIIVSGNLVRDAELRFTPQGTPVAEFRMGIRDDMLKKRENRSVFLDIVLFGQRAEALHKYLLKGKSILVEGRLDVRINKSQDGRTFTNIQVYANRLEFLGRKEGVSGDSSSYANASEDRSSGTPVHEDSSSLPECLHSAGTPAQEETDFEIPEEETEK